MKLFLTLLLCQLFVVTASAQNTLIRTIGNANLDDVEDLIRTRDNGSLMVGYTYNNDVQTWDVYAVKLDSNHTVKWRNSIGLAVSDTATGSENGYCVAQVADGYIIGGIAVYPGRSYMYIVKLANNGSLLWTKKIGELNAYAYDVIQTSDGGILLAGSTFATGRKQDFYLVKLDAAGNLLWARSAGGKKDDIARSVIEVNDGYVAAGVTYSFGAGKSDVYVTKFAKDGTFMWGRTIGGPQDDRGMSVKKTLANGLIIAGATSSFGFGASDGYLVTLDKDGALLGSKTFGAAFDDYINDIIKTNDGGYAVTGGITVEQFKLDEPFIGKLDANQNLSWEKTILNLTNLSTYSAEHMIQTKDSGYAISLQAVQNISGDFGFLTTDKNGNLCPPVSINGGTMNVVSTITEPAATIKLKKDTLFTISSNFFQGGTIATPCSSASFAQTKQDQKLAGAVTSISAARLYPNPVVGSTNLSFTSKTTTQYNIVIHDATGKLLYKKTYTGNAGSNHVVLDLQAVPKGVYTLSLYHGTVKAAGIKLYKQ